MSDTVPERPDAGDLANNSRHVVRTTMGGVVVVERDGHEVTLLVYPQGLDQYVGEVVTLSWRNAGVLGVHLLNTADQR